MEGCHEVLAAHSESRTMALLAMKGYLDTANPLEEFLLIIYKQCFLAGKAVTVSFPKWLTMLKICFKRNKIKGSSLSK